MPEGPSTEIKVVIDNVLDAFNCKNSELFNNSFGGAVAIVDGCTSSEQLRQSAAAKKRGLSHRVGVQATAC